MNEITDDALEQSVKRCCIIAIRIFAIPAALFSAVLWYDITTGRAVHDTAVVVAKDPKNYIRAQGHYHYSELVPSFFYGKLEAGDSLRITLTPICMEWRRVELIRRGTVCASTSGGDLLYQVLFAFLLMMPCFAFIPNAVFIQNWRTIAILLILEFISLMLSWRLVMVMMGQIEKM